MPEFCGLPVVEKTKGLYEQLKAVKGIIQCDWAGHVFRYAKINIMDMINPKVFNPIDKGSPGVFGLDAQGKVIIAIVHYTGAPSDNPLECGPHIYLEEATDTRAATGWGD